MLLRKNHGVAVGSVLKKASSCSATLATPLLLGCVKSFSRSVGQTEVNLSERPFNPSVQRYGPHEIHGATTGPFDCAMVALAVAASCNGLSLMAVCTLGFSMLA